MGAPYIYDISHLRVNQVYYTNSLPKQSASFTQFQEKKRKFYKKKILNKLAVR